MNEALEQLDRLLDLLTRTAPTSPIGAQTGPQTPTPTTARNPTTAGPRGVAPAARDAAAPAERVIGDAIDAERRAPARTTSVRSLRDDPVIQVLRTELINGMVRADVLRQVLSLVNVAVELALRR